MATKTEAQWQAEYDADTLVRYQEIMSDSKRKNAALKAAREKEKGYEKSLAAVKKVTGRKK